MKKFLLFSVLICCFISAMGCGMTYGNVGINCAYSSEVIELPIIENRWVNGGYSSGFKSNNTMQEIGKILKQYNSKEVTFKAEEYFGNRFLLISMIRGDYTHYALLSTYFSYNSNENFILCNMTGVKEGKENTRFLIPFHLLNEPGYVADLDKFIHEDMFSNQQKYETKYDIEDFKNFYSVSNAFDIEPLNDELKVTRKDISLEKPHFKIAETLVINITNENGKNYVQFSF